jgi:transcription antitermination factor NusG
MAETLRASEAGGGADTGAEVRWYACYTRARHEKRVDRLLSERGFDTYLPLMPRVSQWKDRKKVVEWPVFPSYVFGRFSPADMPRVLSTPGVAALVRSNGRPAPIADDELDNVRRLVQVLSTGAGAPEQRPFIAEGEWVEVMGGPFRGLRGVVVQRRNRRRVLIGIKAIGQGLEVDIDTSALRPVAGP